MFKSASVSAAQQPCILPGRRLLNTVLLLLTLILLTSGVRADSVQPWVNVRDFGAVGNGVADDSNALAAAIAAAQQSFPRAAVYIPAGTYRYSRVLRIDGLMVYGEGADKSTLLASNVERSSLVVTGNAPKICDLRIRTAVTPTVRDPRSEATGLDIYEATDFTIQRVHVGPVASAGIFVRRSHGSEATPATIRDCVVEGTLADGIHMTEGTEFVDVTQNEVFNTGDDFIAVVSYAVNGRLSRRINISKNSVSVQSHGRGISVVGGEDVTIDANIIAATAGAGIYIASEDSWNTFGTAGITIKDNSLTNVAKDGTGHGGIHIAGRSSHAVRTVFVKGNRVMDSGNSGLYIDSYTQNVRFEGNEIDGAGRNGITVARNTADIFIVADGSNLNIIRNCAEYGIYVDPRNCSGGLKVSGALIQNINTRRYGHIDAVNVSEGSTFAWIQLLNIRLEQPSSGIIERLVESASAIDAATGNSANRILETSVFLSCPLP
jgi:hypothetical protein